MQACAASTQKLRWRKGFSAQELMGQSQWLHSPQGAARLHWESAWAQLPCLLREASQAGRLGWAVVVYPLEEQEMQLLAMNSVGQVAPLQLWQASVLVCLLTGSRQPPASPAQAQQMLTVWTGAEASKLV